MYTYLCKYIVNVPYLLILLTYVALAEEITWEEKDEREFVQDGSTRSKDKGMQDHE